MDYLAFTTKYLACTEDLPGFTRHISLFGCQSSPGTWYLATSRPTGNVVGNCEILPYLRIFLRFPIAPYGRRLKGLWARVPDGAGGHPRAAGCFLSR
eukprot:6183732-Pleurochrysis_carterae.AAC.1